MANFKILFDKVGAFKQGDVVEGAKLGDTVYLLNVGAIESSEGEERISADNPVVQDQIDAATKPLKEEIAALNDALEQASKAKTVSPKTKDLQDKIKELEKQVTDLTAENEALKAAKPADEDEEVVDE